MLRPGATRPARAARRSKAGRFSTRPQAGEGRSRGPGELFANFRFGTLGLDYLLLSGAAVTALNREMPPAVPLPGALVVAEDEGRSFHN